MRQKVSSEQRHERDGERLETLVEGFEGCFPAQCIANEYRYEVDYVVLTKAPTGEADSFCHGLEQTLFAQMSCDDRYLPEPRRGGRKRLR
jgi:hypothetical protein